MSKKYKSTAPGHITNAEYVNIPRRSLLKGALGLTAAAATLQSSGVLAKPETRVETGAAVPNSSRSSDKKHPRLILLGTAGGPNWYPNDHRRGISSAVVVGDSVYLVGCGEGVGDQYIKATRHENSLPRGKLGFENLRGIFFTHLHSDHTVDYFNLILFGLYQGLPDIAQPVQIHGPGPRGEPEPIFQLPGKNNNAEDVTTINPANPTPGIEYMTEKLYQAYALDINDRMRDNGRQDPRTLVDVNDIKIPDIKGFKSPNKTPAPSMKPFKIYEDENVKISATLVYHFPIWPAFAFRFDTDEGSVVFSGDTSASDNLIHMASGADILVHEVIDSVWLDHRFPPPKTDTQEALRQHFLNAHTTQKQVAQTAEKAGVKTCVLSHIVPGYAEIENLLRAQRYFSGQLIVGDDLMELALNRI